MVRPWLLALFMASGGINADVPPREGDGARILGEGARIVGEGARIVGDGARIVGDGARRLEERRLPASRGRESADALRPGDGPFQLDADVGSGIGPACPGCQDEYLERGVVRTDCEDVGRGALPDPCDLRFTSTSG